MYIHYLSPVKGVWGKIKVDNSGAFFRGRECAFFCIIYFDYLPTETDLKELLIMLAYLFMRSTF